MGGAIFNHLGELLVLRSTFAGNAAIGGTTDTSHLATAGAGLGGALFNLNGGEVELTGDTLASNSANEGGGAVYSVGYDAASAHTASVLVRDSILANTPNGAADLVATAPVTLSAGLTNVAGAQAGGTRDLIESSLITGSATSTTSAVAFDPGLQPLAPNGGPVSTLAIDETSPALDAGESFGLTADARGIARPQDHPGAANAADGADIGAFELEYVPPTPPTMPPPSGSGSGQGSIPNSSPAVTTSHCHRLHRKLRRQRRDLARIDGPDKRSRISANITKTLRRLRDQGC